MEGVVKIEREEGAGGRCVEVIDAPCYRESVVGFLLFIYIRGVGLRGVRMEREGKEE